MKNKGVSRKRQTKKLHEYVRKRVVSTENKPKNTPPNFTSGDGKTVKPSKTNTTTDGNNGKK